MGLPLSSPSLGDSGAGAIRRGTKSSAGFLAGGGVAAVTICTGGALLPSAGAIRRGVQSELAFGRCGLGCDEAGGCEASNAAAAGTDGA